MVVFVSNRGVTVQFVDDESQATLASASCSGKNVAAAKEVGRVAAESAVAKGIRAVVVDRGGFKYHGRVRAVVEAAREVGLGTGTSAPADKQTAESSAPAEEAPAEKKAKEDK